MREIPAADGRGRIHRERLSEANACRLLRMEQLPQFRLLGVIRARRITWRGTNAAILLADELLIRQRLARRIAPKLATHAFVEVLGTGFGKTIRERLQHD